MIFTKPNELNQKSTLSADARFGILGPDPDAPRLDPVTQTGDGHRFLNAVFRVVVSEDGEAPWHNAGTAWTNSKNRLVTAAHVAELFDRFQYIRLIPSNPKGQILGVYKLNQEFSFRLHNAWTEGKKYYEADIAVIEFNSELFEYGLSIYTLTHRAWRRRKKDNLFVVGGGSTTGNVLLARGKYYNYSGRNGRLFYTVNTISGMSGGPATIISRHGLDVVSGMHLGFSAVPYRRLNKNHAMRFIPYSLRGVGLSSTGTER